MKRIFTAIVNHKKSILLFFAVVLLLSVFMNSMVEVNYDINDYLPEDAKSTVSIDIMQDEFEGGIPNARVMIEDVTVPQALEYKEQLKEIDGVTDVTWLDDSLDITVPLEFQDNTVIENYYKNGAALFSVTIDEDKRIDAVNTIREIIGEENSMSGSAVSTVTATLNTVKEIRIIAIMTVIFVFIVLLFTTDSWIEPIIILGGLGIAVIINSGTNLIFGEISFVTNAAGSILQLAVSLDYSVFLIHRFEECRQSNPNIKDAMIDALCKSLSSILSSGLTTVIGFLALVLMQFRIGPDLGIALAKGVAISLITVFVFMPVLILSTYKISDKTRHKKLLPSFKSFGKFVRIAAIPMVCLFAVIIAPSYLASNSNDYYYGSSHIFSEGTQLGSDTEKIESIFGKSDTYVLLVPRGNTATETELSNSLHNIPQVTDIISYVDMAGAEIPTEYLDEDTLSLLMSDNYSRMVISANVPYEGEETFSLVEKIRMTANKYYPNNYYLAGEGVSTYDLMESVTADMIKVNLVAIGAVFIVLLLTLHSITLPIILVLSIETAIWLNLSVPYFAGSPVFYIAYLIISSIQLGATVDYAILMTDRYKENRQILNKKASVIETVSDVTVSILTSGSVLTVVGLLLGYFSTNQLLAQLGIFIGRGAIFSLIIVLLVLPGLLYIFDGIVIKKKREYKVKSKIKKKLQEAM